MIGLKNSNQHGKQTYKFRQFLPENCHVICTPPGSVIHPIAPAPVYKPTQIPSHAIESSTRNPENGKPGNLKPGVTQGSQTTSAGKVK